MSSTDRRDLGRSNRLAFSFDHTLISNSEAGNKGREGGYNGARSWYKLMFAVELQKEAA